MRTPEELRAENAFLRHQLTVCGRGSKKPRFRAWDRFLLVALSRMFSRWRDALVLIKPDTLLRWHRDGFRLLWKWRSRKKPPAAPRVPPDVVDLIRRMATENRLWGAERIRGELLKLMLRTPLWPPKIAQCFPVGSVKTAPVTVLDPHELAAGKLAALLVRSANRGIFDAHRLLVAADRV